MTLGPTTPGTDKPAQAPSHVIGLGASAGGLAPLTEFLAAFPLGRGCALLVVQHLSFTQPSVLGKLLQARTALTVIDAVQGQPLQADHVYVIVPGTRLRVSPTAIEVETLVPPESLPARHVDALFESIAQAWGAKGAGVMLSGMGNDGEAGLRHLLALGGLGAAQAPDNAQFDSMPVSAVALGAAVLVDLPSRLPERLLAAWGSRPPAVPELAAAAPLAAPLADPTTAPAATDPALAPTDEEAAHLQSIMACLAAGGGHDFSLYKPSTLHRRVARRMAVHGLDTMADYVALLRGSPQETDLLFRELLIGVTSFFRDPAVWAALEQTMLPALIERIQARSDKLLRVWVVGCSTGEEAYSLAMLLQEALEAAPACRDARGRLDWRLQIFATDLSDDAIALARRGLFAESSMKGLSDERCGRYFEADGSLWRVKPSLRNTVLFARHDVTTDPPFSRLDLVSCRNLLIYFTSPLQSRVLPLFHYVLRPGGVLLLGNSETVGRFETGFTPFNEKLRLYLRSPQPLPGQGSMFPTKPPAIKLPTTATPGDPPPKAAVPELDPNLSAGAPPQSALASAAERLMLEELAPPAVLTNEAGDILYLSGHTARYLEPAAGKANWNLHAMAQPGLRGPLLSGYLQLAATGLPPPAAKLTFEQGGTTRRVSLSLRAVQLPGHGPMVLVVFRDAANEPVSSPQPQEDSRDREGELNIALQAVQALREEMRTSQEELQSSNEELQSTNEELQSANEELTTSKEEMQAMNEELQSVNAEMQSRLDDLALAQSDLRNLLNSTQIATLFLDAALNVRRFTEQAKKVINLRETDVGRPLSDLTMVLDYPDLRNDITTVLRTLVFSEREIHTSDGRWFIVRIMPYRTLANVIDGAVLTFVDVSAAKGLEAQLRHIAG